MHVHSIRSTNNHLLRADTARLGKQNGVLEDTHIRTRRHTNSAIPTSVCEKSSNRPEELPYGSHSTPQVSKKNLAYGSSPHYNASRPPQNPKTTSLSPDTTVASLQKQILSGHMPAECARLQRTRTSIQQKHHARVLLKVNLPGRECIRSTV